MTKTAQIFEKLYPSKTFLEINYEKPSEYVEKYWETYKKTGYSTNSMNGKIFELIIYTLFIRENILPMYLQAKVAFIPNVEYDLIIYNKEYGPISISLKTSLRERKKQADLEAIALKYVHRKSKCYLISMDKNEVKSAKNDLKEGYLLGLDDIYLANSEEFDNFISRIKDIPLSKAGSVKVIECDQLITTETIKNYANNRK